jgi:hypothetical protein
MYTRKNLSKFRKIGLFVCMEGHNAQDFFEGNINKITIPMLPSTVIELPSTLPATTSALELPKPVAQQAAEVWM